MLKGQTQLYSILFILLWLSGCAVAPHASKDSASPSELTSWQLKGKLAIIQPDERLSVNLHWQHHNKQDDLRLTNLFGSTLLLLNADAQGATVTFDDQTYTGSSASELIARLTGWSVPLTELSGWILGQHTPEGALVTMDEQGWPATVTLSLAPGEAQWQMSYQGWQQIDGYRIPRMVSLRQGNKRLKLALSDWQPESPR
ncbi:MULTISPECIES: lipoprotein insertase outer membrane protein LolB [Ferrimonas]|uniref:lipoprotein insertase outer membrane protein LolB n=1 Tax=Ferrimonas TaxID=44011 RepID=UPI000A01182B|nr:MULTISPECIES: lipoprotein insertase outer membrane protein LolB [Ferrimonas]